MITSVDPEALSYIMDESKNFGKACHFFLKLNIYMFHTPVLPGPGIYSRETLVHTQEKICKRML